MGNDIIYQLRAIACNHPKFRLPDVLQLKDMSSFLDPVLHFVLSKNVLKQGWANKKCL
jgi:hypothetical protein